VLAESFGQVPGFGPRRGASADFQHAAPRPRQSAVESSD
jgi:hypothetical protein